MPAVIKARAHGAFLFAIAINFIPWNGLDGGLCKCNVIIMFML